MIQGEHYATSLISGWLANDEGLYNDCVRIADETGNVAAAAIEIKALALESLPQDIPYPFNDILDGELYDVDWKDIAEQYMPEEEEDEDDETEPKTT
jgi:hypothetical protein